MTLEQNQQWQKAINPLDYLDFYALSDEGQIASDVRLERLEVPEWAVMIRKRLIRPGWQTQEIWVPEFSLRSEVALVGLQIRYSTQEEAEPAYQRLFVRFVTEVLRPVAERAGQMDRYRRNGYRRMVTLLHLCEQFSTTSSTAIWPRHLETLPERIGNPVLQFFIGLNLLLKLAFPRLKPHYGKAEYEEIFDAHHLVNDLFYAITVILNPDKYPDRHRLMFIIREYLVKNLDTQYRWSLEGNSDESPGHTDMVATAFLTALETECPPPDWLPILCP